MKYVFVHFGPEERRVYVNGFLSFINGTDEEILADIEKQLKSNLDAQDAKGEKQYHDYINTQELLYSIQNPTELNSKGEALIRIENFDHTSIKVGYWLEDIKTGAHLVNL